MAGGPAALVCWSTKPIVIDELGLIRGANSKPYWLAILRGRPTWTNWIRWVCQLNSPLKLGDGTPLPLRLLLPVNHSGIAARLTIESLRNWNTTSLFSMTTLTLNRSLVTPRIGAFGPPTTPPPTSVGDGTAYSRTNRLVLADSRGMREDTSVPFRPPGSRLKYGIP